MTWHIYLCHLCFPVLALSLTVTHRYRAEKILQDSGITVTPPMCLCSGKIHMQGKPQQEGYCIHHDSDIAESGESGSEYEEEEEQEQESSDQQEEESGSDGPTEKEQVSVGLETMDWSTCIFFRLSLKVTRKEEKPRF